MWVNPDHVVSLRPLITGAEPVLVLAVEIKLEGTALFTAPLGSFPSDAESNEAWLRFLAAFVGDV